MEKAPEKQFRQKLAYQFAVRLVAYSLLVTIVSTAFLLYRDYQQGLTFIDSQIELIRKGQLESLTTSLWSYREDLVQLQLNGLLQMQYVEYLTISTQGEVKWEAGKPVVANLEFVEFPLIFQSVNEKEQIGVLQVYINYEGLYRQILEKALSILASIAFLIFAIVGAIFYFFQELVVRHMVKITRYIETVKFEKYATPLKLDSSFRNTTASREFYELSDALNSQRVNLNESITALRTSEERYKHLFESSEVSIWNEDFSELYSALEKLRIEGVDDLRHYLNNNEQVAWDMAAMVRVTGVNLATLRLFGAKSEEDFIFEIDKTFGPDTIEVFKNQVCAIWDKQLIYRSEAKYRTLDKRDITCIISLPIPQSKDNSRNVPVSIIDITERKRIEEELLTQSQIISHMEEGAYLIRTSDATIAYANPAFEKMFGYEPGEMLEKHVSIVNAPTDISPEDTALEILRELKASGVWRGEVNNVRKDGTLFWCSASVSTFTHPIYGEVWVAVHSDITEHKRNEELLRRAQKMEAVGQLTGGVAHDFNNILGVILGNADLIKERLPADDHNYRRLIEPVIQAAERGAELTRSLLAFSRKQPLDPKVIDLNQHVNGMLSMLQRVLSETIDIETVHAGGLWFCLVDPGQVENALLNLAINARDAMPAGGKLTIETANTHLDDHYEATMAGPKSGQYVMLAVTDTGEGMTPEGIERAFEPFYTTKELGKGTGLGLSMVYGFAKQSNGHVAIYSEPGEGTTVKLYLPRSHDSVVAEAQSVTAAISEVFDETVLVVEDNEAMRDLTVLILGELGFQVLEADTGEAALSLLKEESHIDLLLSDVVIPGEPTGQALAREALVHHADIKTIFMSGYTESAIIHQGRLDPDVILLQKPFTKKQLALKIRKLLGKL